MSLSLPELKDALLESTEQREQIVLYLTHKPGSSCSRFCSLTLLIYKCRYIKQLQEVTCLKSEGQWYVQSFLFLKNTKFIGGDRIKQSMG